MGRSVFHLHEHGPASHTHGIPIDPRAKLLWLAATLVSISTASTSDIRTVFFHTTAILIAAVIFGAPVVVVLMRMAMVLPFVATFSVVSYLSGDTARAYSLVIKSLLSAAAAVITATTTPVNGLLSAAERLGAPRFLVLITQFLYRYLFVLAAKANRMRMAALMRGGFRWSSAGGAVAGLFGSAHARAEGVHRAMLARGFDGRIVEAIPGRWQLADTAVVAVTALALVGARITWAR